MIDSPRIDAPARPAGAAPRAGTQGGPVAPQVRAMLMSGDYEGALSLARRMAPQAPGQVADVVLGVLVEDPTGPLSPEALAATRRQLRVHNSLISRRLPLLFTPIPKNACSIMKTMMVEFGDDPEAFAADGREVHAYCGQRDIAERRFGLAEWDDPAMPRGVVLRNPFRRLVSGYTNKLGRSMPPRPMFQSTVVLAQRYLGLATDLQRGISFAEFVRYIASATDMQLDPHWRSQSWFVQGSLDDYDLVGRFEEFEGFLAQLEARFDIAITREVPVQKAQTYAQGASACVADRLPAEVRGGPWPAPAAFYTPELVDLVRVRYADDLRLYREAFGVEAMPE